MQHKSLNGYDSQSYQKTSGYFRNARGKFSLCHNFTLSVHLYVTPMILSALSEYMSLVYRLVMICHIWQKNCRVELSSLLRVLVSTFFIKRLHICIVIYNIYIYIHDIYTIYIYIRYIYIRYIYNMYITHPKEVFDRTNYSLSILPDW